MITIERITSFSLTLFWLGFFMYVKWLGGGKILEKVEKILFDPIFSMTSAIFWPKIAKNGQIWYEFQNFVTSYSKMI